MKQNFAEAQAAIEALAVKLRARGLMVLVTLLKPTPPAPPPDPRETHPRCYGWVREEGYWDKTPRRPFENRTCNDSTPPLVKTPHVLSLRITQGEEVARTEQAAIRAAHDRLVDLAIAGAIKTEELRPARVRLEERGKQNKVRVLTCDIDLEPLSATYAPETYAAVLLRTILTEMELPIDAPKDDETKKEKHG